MERDYDPAPAIGRFLAGTPPILVLAAVEEGVRLTAEAGIDALREKSIALTELIVALHDEWLAPLGFELGSPRDPARARLARLAAPPGGVADLPRADRARGRRPRLPRPGLDPARRRAALHALRRRLGRARPPARLVERGEHAAFDAAPGRVTLAAVALLGEHELLGQRGARRRRRVGEHRDGLGDRAGERRACRRRTSTTTCSSSTVGDHALAAGLEALGLEQVQQVLGLVLEAQDRDLGARPRRRRAGRPRSASPGSIGWPCGHVFASPIAASMRASSTGDIACSSRSASSCTSSHGIPSTSVRKRSISRWRRTTPSACSRPSSVNEIDLSAPRVM